MPVTSVQVKHRLHRLCPQPQKKPPNAGRFGCGVVMTGVQVRDRVTMLAPDSPTAARPLLCSAPDPPLPPGPAIVTISCNRTVGIDSLKIGLSRRRFIRQSASRLPWRQAPGVTAYDIAVNRVSSPPAFTGAGAMVADGPAADPSVSSNRATVSACESANPNLSPDRLRKPNADDHQKQQQQSSGRFSLYFNHSVHPAEQWIYLLFYLNSALHSSTIITCKRHSCRWSSSFRRRSEVRRKSIVFERTRLSVAALLSISPVSRNADGSV